MSYTHLSIVERTKLEILHQQGKSARAIACELGRHPRNHQSRITPKPSSSSLSGGTLPGQLCQAFSGIRFLGKMDTRTSQDHRREAGCLRSSNARLACTPLFGCLIVPLLREFSQREPTSPKLRMKLWRTLCA